jgi:hypothetical protein
VDIPKPNEEPEKYEQSDDGDDLQYLTFDNQQDGSDPKKFEQ